MAVLSFTPADAMQTILVEAGTYPSIISKIEGPKAAKSGKSNNIIVTVQIADGKYKGKEKDIMLNSEFDTMQDMDNGMRFYPFNTILEIEAAVNNHKVEPVMKNIDTDELVNRPVATNWSVVTIGGKLENVINAFRPISEVGSGPTF
jgi:hypothetical protein